VRAAAVDRRAAVTGVAGEQLLEQRRAIVLTAVRIASSTAARPSLMPPLSSDRDASSASRSTSAANSTCERREAPPQELPTGGLAAGQGARPQALRPVSKMCRPGAAQSTLPHRS